MGNWDSGPVFALQLLYPSFQQRRYLPPAFSRAPGLGMQGKATIPGSWGCSALCRWLAPGGQLAKETLSTLVLSDLSRLTTTARLSRWAPGRVRWVPLLLCLLLFIVVRNPPWGLPLSLAFCFILAVLKYPVPPKWFQSLTRFWPGRSINKRPIIPSEAGLCHVSRHTCQ